MRLKTEIKAKITPRIKAEIMESTGVHYETVNNWIKGDHPNLTRYGVLLVIANELDVMIADLLDFDSNVCLCEGGSCVSFKDGKMSKPCKNGTKG